MGDKLTDSSNLKKEVFILSHGLRGHFIVIGRHSDGSMMWLVTSHLQSESRRATSAAFLMCSLVFNPIFSPCDGAVILSGSSILSQTSLEMSLQMCLKEYLPSDSHDRLAFS